MSQAPDQFSHLPTLGLGLYRIASRPIGSVALRRSDRALAAMQAAEGFSCIAGRSAEEIPDQLPAVPR
jgi:hypothetical protein